MAQSDDVRGGLRPIKMRDGGPYRSSLVKCVALSTYATDLFVGDPVVRVAAGANATRIDTPLSQHEVGELPVVQRATAGATNYISGVIVDIEDDPRDPNNRYGAASTTRILYVDMNPDTVYEVQADAAVDDANIGTVSNILFTHSGDTVTGRSGCEADATVATGDATYQLYVTGLSRHPEHQDTTAAFTRLQVLINLHTERTASLGI